MYYNCELLIGGLVYPVAEYIKNWDEIESSFKRNDYDGVVRSFSNSFEFVKGAENFWLMSIKKLSEIVSKHCYLHKKQLMGMDGTVQMCA